MDIDRVRYFHVFVETGSLVKASEVLHISQPALSKAIKRLESEVGISLLEPDGRGLKLTPAGVKFQKETSSLLMQWLQIPQNISAGKIEEPTKIGSFEVFTTYFLGHLIKHVDLEALELYEFGPGHLEAAVANSMIDIGITYIPIPKANVEFTEATKIRMGAFGLKKYKNKPLDQLPFAIPLSPPGGTPSKVMGLDGWPDHKFQRKIQYRVTLMESALELCRRGHCIAYLPSFVVELHNQNVVQDLKLIEIQSPVPQKDRFQSVYLIQKKNNKESILFRNIAKALRSLS